MTYTEEQLMTMQSDPLKLRQYFWQVAMRARVRAAKARKQAKQQAITYSPKGFGEVALEGRELLHWADVDERLAQAILDNLDALVQSCLTKEARASI